MLKVLVCDDDVFITSQVNDLLCEIKTANHIEFETDIRNNSDFINTFSAIYDIAIIDIEMPGVNGLELSEKLKEQNPDILVIILTSYSDYLDKAMNISVFRYLSKPIEPDRFNRNFIEAVVKHRQICKQIVVESSNRVNFVRTKDILYIENLKHGSNIVTKYEIFKTNKKPQEWAELICQPACFVYSHKSFLVNLQNVINFSKDFITFSSQGKSIQVPCISRSKYAEFKKAFYSFVGGVV